MKRGCQIVFSGKYPNVLEKWSSGRPIIFETEKQNHLASVKGDVEIGKWDDNSLVFRPLIGFSRQRLEALENKIRAD